MNEVLAKLATLVRLTITDAQTGARAVLGGAIPKEALWTLFLLVAALSGFLSQLTLMLVPLDTPEELIVPSGFFLGTLVGVVILGLSLAATLIGRAFGGQGTFGESLMLITWLQFVMVAVQVVQTALALINPALGVLIGWAGFVLLFWLLTNFIAVLHGFQSLGQVFMMIIASAVGIAFGVSILLALVGTIFAIGA